MAVTSHPVVRSPWWFVFLLGGASVGWGWWVSSSIDLSGWRYGRAEHRAGVVEYCERTSQTVGGTPSRRGGTRSGTPIFRHYFSFDDDRSATRSSGSSYQTGTCLALGSRVRIEYPRGRPELARIVGQRAKPYSAWFGLLLVIPAAGLSLALVIAGLALRSQRTDAKRPPTGGR